jgi:hypothetical protein
MRHIDIVVTPPGSCFAFAGGAGTITVRLARPVAPKAVSLEVPIWVVL